MACPSAVAVSVGAVVQGSGIYELNLILFILAENGFKWVVWLAVEAAVSGVVAWHRDVSVMN